MGMKPEDYDRLLGAVKKNERVVAPPSRALLAKGSTEPPDLGMNKTEAKYAAHLELERTAGRIHAYRFEAVKLRLADNTSLTMDFLVIDCDGFVELHDSKAFWKSIDGPHIEDDAAVKIKVAAEQYPFFKFCIVWYKDGWQRKDY